MTRLTRALVALFVLLNGAGCATILYSPQNVKIKEEIALADSFAAQGNYKGAASGYERTLKEAPQHPWLEQTLFSLGCLYASDKNPDKDFGRALSYFQRLNKEFPQSRFTAGIQVWAGFLGELVELTARTAELAADASLKTKKIKELETLILAQKAAIEALQQQLAKMKEIDIQSEAKAKIKK
jgi:outer membrane protein assembly factor BamD (BamD/ComL family)